jgi:S-adenosylmethionine:tRNA ribosyltransferase-isomerase
MQLADFDFDLPDGLIARVPAPQRDGSRLCVYRRATRSIEHRTFREVVEYLVPGDLLVLNDVRVVPARVELLRPTGGRFEGLVVQVRDREIELMVGESGRLRPGSTARFERDPSIGVVFRARRGSLWVAEVEGESAGPRWLERIGSVPLPPYIRKARRQHGEAGAFEDLDAQRYQTVYAAEGSAVAAPTAGLHFTTELLHGIRARGIEVATIRLDVGPGTFAPVRVENIAEHRMQPESYQIGEEAAEAIAAAKGRGGRVVAVGTTVVRTLEFASDAEGRVRAGSGASDLFIFPGYRFKVVDALLTNFHIPRSTLLMLVSAFAGREATLDLYRCAVREKYRFYSYGDATLFI